MGGKVGRSLDWGFTLRVDLGGVESSDQAQILVSYNRVYKIAAIRFGACAAQ